MRFAKGVINNAKRTLMTSLAFAAMMSLTVNPLMENIGFRSFNRVFGNATLAGIDASARIVNFSQFHTLFIPLCLLAGVLLCHWFTHSRPIDSLNKDAYAFLNEVSLCALALAVSFIINKYNNQGLFQHFSDYGVQTFAIIILMTLILIKLQFMPFAIFRTALFVGLNITFFINFLLQGYMLINSNWRALQFGSIFLISTVIVLLAFYYFKVADVERVWLSLVPLSFGMLSAGLMLELCNVLNQHEIFIVNRLLAAKLVYCLVFIVASLVFITYKQKTTATKSITHWETLALVGLVLSVFYFIAVPPLQIVAGTELFEQANHGMLANDFLAWGRIPIINSFDGHMLAHSLGGLVYGLLNGDILGASYFTYSFIWHLVQATCVFFLYKNIFGKDFSVFFLLFVPLANVLNVSVGVISIIALLFAIKKRTVTAYILLLVSVVISTLYQAPVGLSYGGSAVLTLVMILVAEAIKKKQIKDLWRFLFSFALFVCIMILIWAVFCIIQGVNPITRAFEFIGLTASTNNWAYTGVGDYSSIPFALFYSLLPLLVISCLLISIFRFRIDNTHIASFALLLAFVLNFTRALGRHSLAEYSPYIITIVLWSALLGIILFAASMVSKTKCMVFLATAFLLMGIFRSDMLLNSQSVANAAFSGIQNQGLFYAGEQQKVTRVVLDAPLNIYDDVLSMINEVIPQGETYFDLSSQTMLYALSGREKPTYINQSTLHLSGEFTQECFIEEIENYQGTCDFALLYDKWFGVELDGIPNAYRYYKVYEYLHLNYRPLCKTEDGFSLWIRKERFENFQVLSPVTIRRYADVLIEAKDEFFSHDLVITSVDPFILQSGDLDPYIVISPQSPVSIVRKAGMLYEIEIVYKSSKSGTCQLFFDYRGFNEINSLRKNLDESIEYTTEYFSIPTSYDGLPLNAIRIDPPNGSIFEIKTLRIIERDLTDKESRIVIDEPILYDEGTDINRNILILDVNTQRSLVGATTIYSDVDSAKVLDVSVDENLIQLTIDKPAGIFQKGIVSVDRYRKHSYPIDYSDLATPRIYSLGMIPFVWGQYDEKAAWNNSRVQQFLAPGVLLPEVQQESKYAMITVDTAETRNASLAFQDSDGIDVSIYNFTLREGLNQYIVRVSADWMWGTGDIVSFSLGVDGEASLNSVLFLANDK